MLSITDAWPSSGFEQGTNARMLSAEDVARALGYSESENWLGSQQRPERPYVLRQAHAAGVAGTYLFRTSPEGYDLLSKRSAVHIAQADTVDEAREIHRRLWNLGDAPFLIVVLPSEVRVYTGFRYDVEIDRPLDVVSGTTTAMVIAGLSAFHAQRIDSGEVWTQWGSNLNVNERVDRRLLEDLNILGNRLIQHFGLAPRNAHSLIGKYIYIRYLRERGILSDPWMLENGIDVQSVLGRDASLAKFRQLVNAIEDRFRGRVFPLPLDGNDAPDDAAIAFVASVLLGDSAAGQMSLVPGFDPNFRIYDFSYIPIELLSSIYEQFLHAQGGGAKAGAFYTPEPVAEYLLSELNSAKPLNPDFRILDPSCGSGVFLVLAYRKLVETELQKRPEKKLRPFELRRILTSSIYGVERNPEACYVTEFSLLLTMLSYIDPPELHRNKQFKFPEMHNTQIFEQDFFDTEGPLWTSGNRFDWIVGNPPWVELDPKDESEILGLTWIAERGKQKPVARYRTAEAFAWGVADLLKEDGYAGLLVHATTLTNESSQGFREAFFEANYVPKVTNFANLAYVLFDRRAEAPAATIIFTPTDHPSESRPTTHYGPFVANQLPIRSQAAKRSWVITVYQNEITSIPRAEVTSGNSSVWKMALWGTYRDQAVLSRIRRLFPQSLKALVSSRGGYIGLGVQLRGESDERSGDAVYVKDLKDTKVFSSERMNASGSRFLVPDSAIIDNSESYIRARGGTRGLRLAKAPHLVISPTYAAFSEVDFVLTHPRIGIAMGKTDSDFLRALSVYLNSNLAKYLAFFGSTSWGVDRTSFVLGDVESIPVPQFSDEQIQKLAQFHRELTTESEHWFMPSVDSDNLPALKVVEILELPRSLALLADEFVEIKLSTNKGKLAPAAVGAVSDTDLVEYGASLRDQLDEFAGLRHRVLLWREGAFTCCFINPGPASTDSPAFPVAVESAESSYVAPIGELLRRRSSQWVYVQRSLRIFDGEQVTIVKSSRRIDWTRTQALLDSDDVISEVLSQLERIA